MNESQVKEETVVIPEEHLKVINDTDIVLQQFSEFMDGEKPEILITTEAQYAGAMSVVIVAKEHEKKLLESKEIVVGPAYKSYKAKLAFFTPKMESIKEKIEALEKGGRTFRKKVTDEAAEKQRLEDLATAEKKKKLDDQAADALKKADDYRDIGREDLANKWDSKAQKLEDTSSSTVAQIVTPNIPKNVVGGFNTQPKYAARILRVADLFEHFKASCPPDVQKAAQKWANAQARAAKGTKSLIPGVEFITE